MSKVCCTCKEKLPINVFSKCKSFKDGLFPQCKKCHKKSNMKSYKKRMQNRRVLYMNLKENGCAICGYNNCPDALSFHHVNPEDKKFTIGNEFFKHSEEECLEELNKCILLCRNCHAETHYKEKQTKEIR